MRVKFQWDHGWWYELEYEWDFEKEKNVWFDACSRSRSVRRILSRIKAIIKLTYPYK